MGFFSSLKKGRQKHLQYTKEKASRRLDTETDRRDFMRSYLPHPLPKILLTSTLSYILRHNDEKGMSRAEIIKTSSTLIVAGSETTATLLSGALFHLLKTPSVLSKLTTELLTTFPDQADMTVVKLARLPYLNACLQEALRLYPPVPSVLPRRTQPGGAVINEYYIPENVSLPFPFSLARMQKTEQSVRSPSVCLIGPPTTPHPTSPTRKRSPLSAGSTIYVLRLTKETHCSRFLLARGTV